jgi:hypothetical protein
MRINIPKGWKNITLGTFIQLLDLPETGKEITDFCNKLSVLTGHDPTKLKNNIRTKDLEKLGKKMAFLSDFPKPKKANWFLWKWTFYKRKPFAETTTSQIADIMKLNEKETNEGARILNVLSVIYYTGKEEQYSAERFSKMKAKFENVPFNLALDSSVFFLNGLTTYLQSVLMGYSKFQDKMSLTEMEDLHKKILKINEGSEFLKSTNGTTS